MNTSIKITAKFQKQRIREYLINLDGKPFKHSPIGNYPSTYMILWLQVYNVPSHSPLRCQVFFCINSIPIFWKFCANSFLFFYRSLGLCLFVSLFYFLLSFLTYMSILLSFFITVFRYFLQYVPLFCDSCIFYLKSLHYPFLKFFWDEV